MMIQNQKWVSFLLITL